MIDVNVVARVTGCPRLYSPPFAVRALGSAGRPRASFRLPAPSGRPRGPRAASFDPWTFRQPESRPRSRRVDTNYSVRNRDGEVAGSAYAILQITRSVPPKLESNAINWWCMYVSFGSSNDKLAAGQWMSMHPRLLRKLYYLEGVASLDVGSWPAGGEQRQRFPSELSSACSTVVAPGERSLYFQKSDIIFTSSKKIWKKS